MTTHDHRRRFLQLGGVALAAAGTLAALDPERAAAQASSQSLLRTVLNRGRLIVGTGSTNPPWHFEDDTGKLTGMDIAMARILAKGLFGDESKIDFVQQDPAARIPNIATGKVDIVIQFMTVTSQRAQLVNFSRPYYVEGAALMTAPIANGRPTRTCKRPENRCVPPCFRTSAPMTWCTRPCPTHRCCSSIPRPTSCRPCRPAAPMSRWSMPPRSSGS